MADEYRVIIATCLCGHGLQYHSDDYGCGACACFRFRQSLRVTAEAEFNEIVASKLSLLAATSKGRVQ